MFLLRCGDGAFTAASLLEWTQHDLRLALNLLASVVSVQAYEHALVAEALRVVREFCVSATYFDGGAEKTVEFDIIVFAQKIQELIMLCKKHNIFAKVYSCSLLLPSSLLPPPFSFRFRLRLPLLTALCELCLTTQLASSVGSRLSAAGSQSLCAARERHAIVSHVCAFVSSLYHLSLGGAEPGSSGLDLMHHLTLTTPLITDLLMRYLDSVLSPAGAGAGASASAALRLSGASDANDSDEMREAVSTVVRVLQVLIVLSFRVSALQPSIVALARHNATHPLWRLLSAAPALCARVPALCVLSTLLAINTNSFAVNADAKTEQVNRAANPGR